MATKFYKDSNGIFFIGDASYPSGVYSANFSENDTKVTITNVMTGEELKPVALITSYTTSAGVAYADRATFSTALKDFFVKSAGISSGVEVVSALGYTPEDASKKGAANGYAPLDSASKVPAVNLPSALAVGAISQSIGTSTTNAPSEKAVNDYINRFSQSATLRDPIYIDTAARRVYSVGVNFLFCRNENYFLNADTSVVAPTSDYYFIYTSVSSKTFNCIVWSSASSLPSDAVLLAIVNFQSGGAVVWCNCNTFYLNGNKYENYYRLPQDVLDIASNVDRLIAHKSAFVFQPDLISIVNTATTKTMTIAGNVQIFFSKNTFAGSSGGFIGFNANQTIDINTVSGAKDYLRLYVDPISKVFVLKGYNSWTDTEMKEYVYVGMFYITTNKTFAYLHSGQRYFVNNVSVVGNGEIYPSANATSLKYAEIGDSITFLADNKYETSYDDSGTSNTGYKGWGYGRYFCKAMGIPYENHFPQGANGRTFADYLDEWNLGHWDWANDTINFWTIFLGTNDWGTERNPLGTQADYINDTYTAQHRTTYGAIRKIVDKIRSKSTNTIKPKIVFITPMQRGAFAYGSPLGNFMKSAIKIGQNGYEYVQNSYGFTLKDVVDAIIWICEYESFGIIDLFNDSVVDKKYLNMCQQLSEINPNNWIYQDVLYDNLHPTDKGFKLIGARLIEFARKYMYDIFAKK